MAVVTGLDAAASVWLIASACSQLAGQGEACPEPADPLSRALLHPMRTEVVDAEFDRLRAETVHFENQQGAQLRGLWFESAKSDDVVLTCMGNTGNATWMLPFAAILVDAGFDVLLFDYQGFGASDGIASLVSLPGDIFSAWDFVTQEKKRTPEQIGVLGISLGSVGALELAAEKKPRACAIEDVYFPDQMLAGFGEAPDVATKAALAALQIFVLPKVDPKINAKKYSGPLFLIHGDRDWLLPPTATVELAKLRPQNTRTWILPATGHSPDSLQIDEWEYRDQLAGFFRDAFACKEGKLDEPRASCEVVAEQPLRVKVSIEANRAGPLLIELIGEPHEGQEFRSNVHYERRVVAAGVTTFECAPDFASKKIAHVGAIVARNAKAREDGTWEPVLSPMSRSLTQFDEAVEKARFAAIVQAAALRAQAQKTRVDRAAVAAEQWRSLREFVPKAADVAPRVRPRWARLLARLAAEMADAPKLQAAALETAEAMLPFLPDDPAHFMTLGNAFIEVGFDPPEIIVALGVLLNDRTRRQDPAGVAAIERALATYRPSPPQKATK